VQRWPVLLGVLTLAATQLCAADDQDAGSRTVLGPRNIFLYDGANELMAGNAKEGVRLTVLGLQSAHGPRERQAAHANLCAGFMMLEQLHTALEHCDWVLERYDNHWRTYNNRALVYLFLERFEESEADIRRGQELKPESENLKEVRGMYLDEVAPVTEQILIDERRRKTEPPVLNKPADEVE
jgi:tetratricopeptide (TPR) repeat protein